MSQNIAPNALRRWRRLPTVARAYVLWRLYGLNDDDEAESGLIYFGWSDT